MPHIATTLDTTVSKNGAETKANSTQSFYNIINLPKLLVGMASLMLCMAALLPYSLTVYASSCSPCVLQFLNGFHTIHYLIG